MKSKLSTPLSFCMKDIHSPCLKARWNDQLSTAPWGAPEGAPTGVASGGPSGIPQILVGSKKIAVVRTDIKVRAGRPCSTIRRYMEV